MRILILDTGLRIDHPALKNATFNGYSLDYYNGKLFRSENYNDENGHGTAVYHIIYKNCANAEIIMVKIFNNTLEISEEAFSAVLAYIRDNEKVDVINLSLGINICQNEQLIYDICKSIVLQGTIIVSAFDNSGAISYPAAFDCVIGVDCINYINNEHEYAYVESGVVNILTKGGMSRLAWLKPDYILTSGASFACAYATSILAKQLIQNCYDIKKNALYSIKHPFPYNSVHEHPFFTIHNVALFPFNKEMHSIARFFDMLSFNIKAICDVRLSGRVGMPIRKYLGNQALDISIIDVNSLPWDEIDTLIIGHMDEMSILLKNSDFKNVLLKQALTHNKNIYSFDPLNSINHPRFYYPYVNEINTPHNMGKLYRIFTPVLGVFGTSSQQGKFTLQLILRRELIRCGYKVGQLGTEPSSPLFGMDAVFPYGYNSTVSIHDIEIVSTLNNQMRYIDQKNYEIIIVGSQAGTIPYVFSNSKQIFINQSAFLYGTQPDGVILAINPYDDVDYIKRTISFIESSINCKVLAASLFPLSISNDYTGLMGIKTKLSEDELESLTITLSELLNVPVYVLGDQRGMSSLVEVIINFFSC